MYIYIVIINLISLIIMALDKSKAKHHHWRIPESTLFFFALIGGSLGIYLGMYLFKHKTNKIKFYLGIPLLIILEIVLITFCFYNLTV